MSEQKDKRRLILSQAKTFHSIYQSRIVTSYPPCLPLRTLITPHKNANAPQRQYLIQSKKSDLYQNADMFKKSLSEQKRPRSLDFKNNLFSKLASKIQRQKEIQHTRNEEVLNEYYDSGVNKQNDNKSNNLLASKVSPLKKSIYIGKFNIQRGNRYDKAETACKTSKEKIKFNKLKPSLLKKKSTEDIDFVRTSDGDFHITKSSLDMRPLI